MTTVTGSKYKGARMDRGGSYPQGRAPARPDSRPRSDLGKRVSRPSAPHQLPNARPGRRYLVTAQPKTAVRTTISTRAQEPSA
jgi:hypothetical protein